MAHSDDYNDYFEYSGQYTFIETGKACHHSIKQARELAIWNPETGELFKYEVPQELCIISVAWPFSVSSNRLIVTYDSGEKQLVDFTDMSNVSMVQIPSREIWPAHEDYFNRELRETSDGTVYLYAKALHGFITTERSLYLRLKEESNLRFIQPTARFKFIWEEDEPTSFEGLYRFSPDDDLDAIYSYYEKNRSVFWLGDYFSTIQRFVIKGSVNGVNFVDTIDDRGEFYRLESICNFEVFGTDNVTIAFGYADADNSNYTIEYWDIGTHSCIKKLTIPGKVKHADIVCKDEEKYGSAALKYSGRVKVLSKKDLANFAAWGLFLLFDNGHIEYWDLAQEVCVRQDHRQTDRPVKYVQKLSVFSSNYLAVDRAYGREDLEIFDENGGRLRYAINLPQRLKWIGCGSNGSLIAIDDDGCTVYFLPETVIKHLTTMRPEQAAVVLEIANALNNGTPMCWNFLTQEQKELLSGSKNAFVISVRNQLKKNFEPARKMACNEERIKANEERIKAEVNRMISFSDHSQDVQQIPLPSLRETSNRVARIMQEEAQAMIVAAGEYHNIHNTISLLPLSQTTWVRWLKRQYSRWPVKLFLAAASGVGAYYGWQKWGHNWFKFGKVC